MPSENETKSILTPVQVKDSMSYFLSVKKSLWMNTTVEYLEMENKCPLYVLLSTVS